MGVAADIKRNLGVIKKKLAADASDFLTVAAHGLTKDALHRIKTLLLHIMPSLSPAITTTTTTTTKMVDDVEKDANGERECEGEEEGEEGHQQKHHKSPYVLSPTPISRL